MPRPGQEPNDAALVAEAQAQPEKFAALYERYVGQVYRYCYLRLGSQGAAEDATSETFLKALASIGGYRGGSFAAWVFRIAHKVVVDFHRRRSADEPHNATEHAIDPSVRPDELLAARSERESLRRAVVGLATDQRTAIELELAGWRTEQIGAALNRSPEAVKKLRFGALRRLRKAVEQ